MIDSRICAGQESPRQRTATSPGIFTISEPHSGQASGDGKRLFPSVASFGQNLDHRRDHVAGALDHHRVADADILALHLLPVVQGRPARP